MHGILLGCIEIRVLWNRTSGLARQFQRMQNNPALSPAQDNILRLGN